MLIHLMRLVLIERQQPDLFSESAYYKPLPTREEWLKSIFFQELRFNYRKGEFVFVPIFKSEREFSDIIYGRIGRRRLVKENEPPDQGLEETERHQWKAARVFVDPRHHSDGQKVGFEFDRNVGLPLALMRALADHINSDEPYQPYVIEVNNISETDSFWNFVNENEGQITTVTFELVAPNMFGIRSQLDTEMKELRDQERVRRAKFTAKNEDGLKLLTERVRQTAEYAAEGGESISARTKSGRRFNSASRVKTVKVEISSLEEEENISALRRLIKAIFGQ